MNKVVPSNAKLEQPTVTKAAPITPTLDQLTLMVQEADKMRADADAKLAALVPADIEGMDRVLSQLRTAQRALHAAKNTPESQASDERQRLQWTIDRMWELHDQKNGRNPARRRELRQAQLSGQDRK